MRANNKRAINIYKSTRNRYSNTLKNIIDDIYKMKGHIDDPRTSNSIEAIVSEIKRTKLSMEKEYDDYTQKVENYLIRMDNSIEQASQKLKNLDREYNTNIDTITR